MTGLASQTKIIILAIGFVLFAAGMYLFGYGIMAGRNQVLTDAIAEQNVQLEVLQREQKSFEQGKKDLAILEKSTYPPDELFSQDTKVVKEIQQIETAAQRYGVELSLSVSGSAKAAKKVEGTASELYVVPYTITLNGSIDNILQLIQAIERMPFVTHVNTLSIMASPEDQTKTVIASEFYIKKWNYPLI